LFNRRRREIIVPNKVWPQQRHVYRSWPLVIVFAVRTNQLGNLPGKKPRFDFHSIKRGRFHGKVLQGDRMPETTEFMASWLLAECHLDRSH
jgi:hypothetical protein